MNNGKTPTDAATGEVTLNDESVGHKDDARGSISNTGSDAAGSEQCNEATGARLLLLFASLCLSNFLVGLDFTLIASAVPRITSQFNSVKDVGWYGGAFYLALCASQPLAGKAFVLFPKQIVYLSSLLVFEIGSLVCATAPSSGALIAGRAIAGLGASGIFAGGMIIVITIVPLHKRAIYQGLINSTFSIASIIGPVIGGALTQHVSWRWCFYINLPAGGAVALVVLLLLRLYPADSERLPIAEKLRSLDGVGFALFAGAVLMLLLALQFGGVTYAWNSSVVIGLFVGAAASTPLFIWQQLRMKDAALIPPRIFANRNFDLIFASAWFLSGPFQTVVYWLPIWFQGVEGISPTASGVRYLAVVISDVVTSLIGATSIQAIGYFNPFLLAGFAFNSVGSGLLTTLHPGITEAKWIGYEILCGIGYSLMLTSAHLGVQSSLPADIVSLGSTTLLFAISASCAIYLSIGQAVFQSRLASNLAAVVSSSEVSRILSAGASNFRSAVSQDALPEVVNAYSNAVTRVFFIPAAATVVGFILICGTKPVSVKRHRPDKKNEADQTNTLD